LQRAGNGFQFAQHSIHADAHHRHRGLRLDMNVTGLFRHGRLNDFGYQAYSRRLPLMPFCLDFLDRLSIGLAAAGGDKFHFLKDFVDGLLNRGTFHLRRGRFLVQLVVADNRRENFAAKREPGEMVFPEVNRSSSMTARF